MLRFNFRFLKVTLVITPTFIVVNVGNEHLLVDLTYVQNIYSPLKLICSYKNHNLPFYLKKYWTFILGVLKIFSEQYFLFNLCNILCNKMYNKQHLERNILIKNSNLSIFHFKTSIPPSPPLSKLSHKKAPIIKC